MEKYLVIIILVVLAYYVHRYCIQVEIEKILKTKEGFVDTVNTSDPDLYKSIITLGQICKDLQAGGINVPGNLNIKGVINTTGDINAGGNLSVNGNLSVKGDVIRSNPIYRKHDIVGYYSILEKGCKIPLYYGINMTWGDWNVVVKIREKYTCPVNWAGMDLRWLDNIYFRNGNLVVFPTYKCRLYFLKTETSVYALEGSKPYKSGEYNFKDHPAAVRIIYVEYADGTDPPTIPPTDIQADPPMKIEW
jgi:hypothetical protein